MQNVQPDLNLVNLFYMDNKMTKGFTKIFGLIIALAASSAQALPTLYFDGDISYSSSSGELSVVSVLTATQEIFPSPELVGSSLDFSASLSSVDVSSSIRTIGQFSGGPGDDISVIDGDSNNLLFGEFTSLTMMGRNGKDSGRITGTMNATDGSLQSYFGQGQLIALVFNMNTVFSADMFNNSFTGNIDGRIEGEARPVPAPGVLALLGFGLIFMGIIRTHSRHL